MTVRRTTTLVAAALLLALTVTTPSSSGAQDTDAPDLGTPVAGVSTVVQRNSADHDPAVVFIQMFFGQQDGICTGTLVDPEWVLTAAHCVKDGGYADRLDVWIGSVDVTQDFASPAPGVEHWTSDGFVVNGDASIGDDDAQRWFDDLAMVHLPGESAITPMPLATDASLVRPASRNATITTRFYGFGASECGFGDSCQADGKLRLGESRIYRDDLVEDLIFITTKELNRNFYLLPQPSVEGAGCFGDSGGPVVAEVNGQRQIIGVNGFVLTLVPNLCEPFPPSAEGPSSPWYGHGAVDLVGTNLGNWVRSIMNASATCGGEPADIVGSRRNDVLVGTPQANVMAGRGGPDLLIGRGGDDLLCGGGGADDLRGGPGNDVLVGNGGRDALRGQGGNDDISGGRGADDVKAGGGADAVDGGRGNDKLRGARGIDTLLGGGGNDDISGGGGADFARGGAGADLIKGNAGDDDLRGNAGDDTIIGGAGNDRCRGGGGSNTITDC